jgi:phosphoenolpyruvate phosphomutase
VFAFAEGYAGLCRRLGFRRPLISIPTTYCAATEEELRSQGFDMVIYANHLLRASFAAMQKTCRVILESGRSFEAEPFCATVKAVSDAVGFADVTQKDEQAASVQPRVIIPAAGRPEPELVEHFGGLPVSALPLKEKTVLQRQLATLRESGLTDVCVVTGYEAQAVEAGRAQAILNPDFDTTHILDSVFRAEEHMYGGFLLTYADILFDRHIIDSVLHCTEDMVVVIDSTYIRQRSMIAKSKIELVTVKRGPGAYYRRLTPSCQEVQLIGASINPELATHEFVGIAFFSARGAEILRHVYHDARKKYRGRRFQEAGVFEKAAFIDLLQEVIDLGFSVHALEVSQGWVEMQSLADYRHALEMIE